MTKKIKHSLLWEDNGHYLANNFLLMSILTYTTKFQLLLQCKCSLSIKKVVTQSVIGDTYQVKCCLTNPELPLLRVSLGKSARTPFPSHSKHIPKGYISHAISSVGDPLGLLHQLLSISRTNSWAGLTCERCVKKLIKNK